MSLAAAVAPAPPAGRWTVAWAAMLLFAVALYLAGDLTPWAAKYPKGWMIPLRFWISDFMKWLINDASFGLFTFKELTRSIAWLLTWPLDIAEGLLASGFELAFGADDETVYQLPRI